MGLHKISELTGTKLDCATAIATGRAVRRGRRATDVELRAMKAPFEVFEVIQKLGPPPQLKTFFLVRSVTVTGVGDAPGAAGDRIVRYIDRDGEERTGSPSLFFLDRAEADLERQGHANGFYDDFRPSTCAAHVLPLMNDRAVRLSRFPDYVEGARCEAEVEAVDGRVTCEGPTLEIAFCRALASSVFGEEVDLPDWL